MFWSAGCPQRGTGGFSCSLKASRGGPKIKLLHFLKKKIVGTVSKLKISGSRSGYGFEFIEPDLNTVLFCI